MLDKVCHLTQGQLDKILSALPTTGKHTLPSWQATTEATQLPWTILEDFAYHEIKAEVHHTDGDIFYCLSGTAEFVCGGELVDPKVKQNADGTLNKNEVRGTSITNGTTYKLRAGEWLWIPASQPHYHTAELARLLVIKLPS